VRERDAQRHARRPSGVQDGVRKYQLSSPSPDVEFHHVDADLVRRAERGERISRRESTGATMADPLTLVGHPLWYKMPAPAAILPQLPSADLPGCRLDGGRQPV
jgi:hypothetical protein